MRNRAKCRERKMCIIFKRKTLGKISISTAVVARERKQIHGLSFASRGKKYFRRNPNLEILRILMKPQNTYFINSVPIIKL